MLIFAVMSIEQQIYNGLPDIHKQERFLFRGFSIEKVGQEVIIKDIRSVYYKVICKDDLKILSSKGFIKGTTYLLMLSDQKKIESFKILEQKNKALAKVNANPRKNQEYLNSVRVYKRKIEYYVSQVRRWRNQLLISNAL